MFVRVNVVAGKRPRGRRKMKSVFEKWGALDPSKKAALIQRHCLAYQRKGLGKISEGEKKRKFQPSEDMKHAWDEIVKNFLRGQNANNEAIYKKFDESITAIIENKILREEGKAKKATSIDLWHYLEPDDICLA